MSECPYLSERSCRYRLVAHLIEYAGLDSQQSWMCEAPCAKFRSITDAVAVYLWRRDVS